MNYSNSTANHGINATMASVTKRLVNTTMSTTTTHAPEWFVYQKHAEAVYQSVISIRLAMSVFGLIAAIFLSGTLFRNKVLNAPCFYCYQAMSVVSGLFAFVEFNNLLHKVSVSFNFDTLKWLIENSVVFSWLLQTYPIPFYGVFQKSTYEVEAILIAYLSFHRGMACFAPGGFKRIDSNKICLGITIAACCFFFFLNFLEFYTRTLSAKDAVRVAYVGVTSHLALWRMVLVIATTAFAVAGLVQAFHHRRRLFSKVSPNQLLTPAQIVGRKGANKNLSMCYLQISQALPIAIQCTLVTISNAYFTKEPVVNGTSDLSYAYGWIIVQRGKGLADSAYNDLHFIFFLIFAENFRRAFMKRFLRKPRCCQ